MEDCMLVGGPDKPSPACLLGFLKVSPFLQGLDQVSASREHQRVDPNPGVSAGHQTGLTREEPLTSSFWSVLFSSASLCCSCLMV